MNHPHNTLMWYNNSIIRLPDLNSLNPFRTAFLEGKKMLILDNSSDLYNLKHLH